MNEPIVSIACITYNHEKYIKDAIEGFLMQKTSFPYEIIIHDDASTDKTADIIKIYAEKYGNIIIPIYQKENQYSKGKKPFYDYVYPKIKGKYIAFCEGDDYWIDPYKIQKQYDQIEQNSSIGAVYTRSLSLYEKKQKILKRPIGSKVNRFDDLIVENNIPSLTVMLRSNLMDRYLKEEKENIYKWKIGDYPLWLYIIKNSNIKYLNDVTAVYRIRPESASRSNDAITNIKIADSVFSIQKYYSEKYAVSEIIKEKTKERYYRNVIYWDIISAKNNYTDEVIKKLKIINYPAAIIVLILSKVYNIKYVARGLKKILFIMWR